MVKTKRIKIHISGKNLGQQKPSNNIVGMENNTAILDAWNYMLKVCIKTIIIHAIISIIKS